MLIRKAVITAAGLGTRLLPVTKEVPKEVLPLFVTAGNGVGLKPVIQVVFESLHVNGFREFCFIVGRGKRLIEDYFTPDSDFINMLINRGYSERAGMLMEFYKLINESKILFVNQPEPRGFGHAVLYAGSFISSEPFLLHAGDDVIFSEGGAYVNRLIQVFNEYEADVVFLVEEVEDPRAYGVITGKVSDNLGHILRVVDVVEKPERPPSNLAIVAVYVFKPMVIDYIKKVKPDSRGEVQLTDAIKLMVDDGYRVYAVKLLPHEKRLDVGTPEKYWQALTQSYEYAIRKLLKRST